MSEEQIEVIETALQKVSLEPGDVLVFLHPGCLSSIAVESIIKTTKEVFPDNKAMILEEGMKIGAVKNGNCPNAIINSLLDKIESSLGHYSPVGGLDCPYIKTNDAAIKESVAKIREEIKDK